MSEKHMQPTDQLWAREVNERLLRLELKVERIAAVFLCPVCDGCGRVEDGFYIEGPSSYRLPAQECRTCKGAGTIWRTKEAGENETLTG